MSLGEYPQISLTEARLGRDDKRCLIANGVDPVEKRERKKST